MEILKSQRESAKKRWSEFFESDKPRILVGAATCGRAAGALDVMEEFKKELSAAGISDKVELVETGCLGLCYAEPLVEIRACGTPSVLYSNVSPKDVAKLVKEHVVGGNAVREKAEAVMSDAEYDGIVPFKKHPMVELQKRVVLRNCGVINPDDFWHYLARGGYEGLERAFSMSPEDVIEEMKKSGLRGRGGAGFPTGMKWSFARASKSDEKYIICNADEGDPGAFMDRSVLEGDPHAIVEGLMIAGYAIGAQHAYIYVRSEYPLAIERLKTAIKQAEEAGLCAKARKRLRVRNKNKKRFWRVCLRRGNIAHGEHRGRPRNAAPKAAVPRKQRAFQKPTNINNVETLAATSSIMRMGADKYAAFGSEKSRGTKTFSLAGKIKRTGLIEVELGIKLGDIVNKIGGGCTDGKNFKAVQTGGPSGGCLTKEHFGLPVDYENLAAVGSIIGSGGMVVMNEDSCMVEVAKYFVNFTENESCGKCVPCRMGTQHLHRILEKITSGHGEEGDIERLKKIAQTMKESSLCGLGQTAPNPILTTLRYFGDEYKAHIEEKKCPALACSKLVVYAVERDKCKGCTLCERACPTGAISGGLKKPHSIDASKCISCGACFQTCKFGAITRR